MFQRIPPFESEASTDESFKDFRQPFDLHIKFTELVSLKLTTAEMV